MKAVWVLLLSTVSTAPHGFAQTTAAPASPPSQPQNADELRAIQEQRAALLRELQQLRARLAESDARIEATRERVRELQSQQPQPVTDKP